MFHLLTKLAVLRYRRHLQALTFNIEQPTMIRTTQSTVLDIAVFQRSSAMGAVLAKESHFTELIPK